MNVTGRRRHLRSHEVYMFYIVLISVYSRLNLAMFVRMSIYISENFRVRAINFSGNMLQHCTQVNNVLEFFHRRKGKVSLG